jgi:hypothetical protein
MVVFRLKSTVPSIVLGTQRGLIALKKMIVFFEGSQAALVWPTYKSGVTMKMSFTFSEPCIVLYICEN